MAVIVISADPADASRVQPILRALQKEGHQVTKHPARDAEARYDCLVVLWSEASVRSERVEDEAYVAAADGVLVGVLIDDVRSPRRFRRAPTADLVDWGGDREDPGWRDLLAAIEDTLETDDPWDDEEIFDERVVDVPEPPPALASLLGRPVRTLDGHEGEVYDLAFSRDATLLATAAEDGTARLWRPGGGVVGVLRGHGDEVNDVAFSPDGKTVATACDDGGVRLWSVRDLTRRSTLEVHDGPVYGVAYSPAGTYFASCGADARVLVWDAASGEVRWELVHDDEVTVVRFTADGTMVMAGTDDGVLAFWDTADGANLLVIDAHDGPVTDAALSPSGRRAASCSETGGIAVWSLPEGRLAWFETVADSAYGVALSRDGTVLASSDDDGVELWRAADGEPIARHDDPGATRLEFAPAGTKLAWASGGVVRVVSG